MTDLLLGIKRPVPGIPRRSIHPLTVASFRTWRGWAAHVRTVPDTGQLIVIRRCNEIK